MRFVVYVTGLTGSGASSFVNSLAQRDACVVGHGVRRTTLKCSAVDAKWLGRPEGPELTLINGTSLEGEGSLLHASEFLRAQQPALHGVVLVLKATEHRFDGAVQAMLARCQTLFTDALWEYAAVVLTHCDPESRSVWQRNAATALSDGADGLNGRIRAAFPHVRRTVPVVLASSYFSVAECEASYAPLCAHLAARAANPLRTIRSPDELAAAFAAARALEQKRNAMMAEKEKVEADLERALLGQWFVMQPCITINAVLRSLYRGLCGSYVEKAERAI